jgi:hypothetical protein
MNIHTPHTNTPSKVAFGGATTGGTILRDVVVFDVQTNVWMTVNTAGTAPSGRASYASANMNSGDILYVVSGTDGYGISDLEGTYAFHFGECEFAVDIHFNLKLLIVITTGTPSASGSSGTTSSSSTSSNTAVSSSTSSNTAVSSSTSSSAGSSSTSSNSAGSTSNSGFNTAVSTATGGNDTFEE